MVGIALGLAYANLGEWMIHRYVLHGLGRRRGSFWSFHWREHHREARRGRMRDPSYERSVLGWHAQGKEALGLAGIVLLHLPLLPVAPLFTATVAWSALHYYRAHKRAHVDPAWAREHLPWHVDHHLGPDQDANWCVTRPWADLLLGTRRPWLGASSENPSHSAASAI